MRPSRLLLRVLALATLALVVAGCARDSQRTTTRTTTLTKTVVQADPSDVDGEAHDDAGDDTAGDGSASDEDAGDGDGKPAIVVNLPKPFDVVVGSFVLAGNANVFEANVSYQLTGGLGDRVFLRGYTTAACGTGCRGRFRKRVGVRRVPVGNYTLRVFEASAQDGSHLFEVQVPLTVHR